MLSFEQHHVRNSKREAAQVRLGTEHRTSETQCHSSSANPWQNSTPHPWRRQLWWTCQSHVNQAAGQGTCVRGILTRQPHASVHFRLPVRMPHLLHSAQAVQVRNCSHLGTLRAAEPFPSGELLEVSHAPVSQAVHVIWQGERKGGREGGREGVFEREVGHRVRCGGEEMAYATLIRITTALHTNCAGTQHALLSPPVAHDTPATTAREALVLTKHNSRQSVHGCDHTSAYILSRTDHRG